MYNFRDLYPDIGLKSTTEKSLPEREEQRAYRQEEGNPTDLDTLSKMPDIMMAAFVMVAVVVLMSVS